ncbi:MAG: N-acetylmuramoyl-L-alanine amidase [Lachnospiraceae bacterium]|jgi:hypothetical protein|nr:N-acetylmuramoyl-L-alanine amidase [Lachnospiraceae bacterium]
MEHIRKKQYGKKRKRNRLVLILMTSFSMLILGFITFTLLTTYSFTSNFGNFGLSIQTPNMPVMIDSVGNRIVKEMLLTPNPYSRPQTILREVNSVVIHYTANPGTDAEANRNYFENLKTSHATYASSHFVIGLDGQIIQCIPLNEISFASNNRNGDTISIECCHPGDTGEFSLETYESLVALTAWVCEEYSLSEEDILRHYDVSGKNCPLYYVNNEDAWLTLKEDVMNTVSDSFENDQD